MSSSMVYSTSSPFDIPSIQRSIDAALATVPKDQHGNLVFDVRKDKASAALLLRAGDRFEAVAWVTKPYAGTVDYGLSGRVKFASGPFPEPLAFGQVRGYYRLLRAWNGRGASAWKALRLWAGWSVRLIG